VLQQRGRHALGSEDLGELGPVLDGSALRAVAHDGITPGVVDLRDLEELQRIGEVDPRLVNWRPPSMMSLRVTCARFPAMPATAEASSTAGTPLWDLGPIRAQVPMDRRRRPAVIERPPAHPRRTTRRGRTRPAIALGCTSFTASPERAGCVPSETAVTRITSAAPQRRCSAHPLAGGAGHYLDSAVALAAQLVGIIALGPFRTETAHLDPVS